MNRKDFIKNTALSLAGITIVPRAVLGGANYIAPSDRINLGYIGTGKQVPTLLNGLGQLPETMVVAASDVDKQKLAHFINLANNTNLKKNKHNVDGYSDYRELLSRKDIDAIVVAPPTHSTAIPASYRSDAINPMPTPSNTMPPANKLHPTTFSVFPFL